MIKKLIRKLILRERYSSESYINYLRKKGVYVGENVEIFRPFNTTIDVQNPHLLYIGNHVMMTGPITILTHDYSWSVLKRKYGEVLGNQKMTKIGDNCFLGWGATILAGSIIGNNVIVGAGSVVSGKLENDSVYAGNPAKKIMSLEDFYKKRKSKQLDEAIDYIKKYEKCYGKMPQENELDEYFYLFSSDPSSVDSFSRKMSLMMNEAESYLQFKRDERRFKCFQELIDFVSEKK